MDTSTLADVTLSLRPLTFDLVNARKLALEAWKRRNSNAWFDGTQHAFIDRITVNYLRHCWTCYDDLRHTEDFASPEGTLELKLRILDLIEKRYPALARECERQRERARLATAEMSTPIQTAQPSQAADERIFAMSGLLRRQQEAHATLRAQHEELIEKFIELMVVAEQLAN